MNLNQKIIRISPKRADKASKRRVVDVKNIFKSNNYIIPGFF